MNIPKEMDEKTYEEFLNLLSTVSEFVVAHPDSIDMLRKALKTSAALMYSNRPEVIEDYQDVTRDVDSFLQACKTGEVDPKGLIRKKKGTTTVQ